MKRFLILSLVFMFVFLSNSQAQKTEYDLYLDGKVAGNCAINITQRGAGWLVQKNSVLNNGRIERKVSEEILVDAQWMPETYRLTVTSPEGTIDISGKFDDKGVVFTGKVGMGSTTKTITSSSRLSVLSEDVCMACPMLLISRMDLSGVGSTAKFSVAIPEAMELSEITLSVTGINERVYTIKGERTGGKQWEAWFDSANKRLTRFILVGGYEAKLKAEAPKPTKLPEGYHPITTSMLGDASLVSRISETKKLTASIAFDFPEDASGRLYLSRFAQDFNGTIGTNNVTGSITSKKWGHKVTNTPNWPLVYPLSGVDESYSLPERWIDSDDADIIERAKKIVIPAKTAWDAARAIGIWVNRNIEYSKETGGAIETFKSKKGDSRAMSFLCIAMCRAVGIPARIVNGILWADGASDHAWVEVWLGEKAGWGPIDPVLDQADRIDACHISVWLGTELPPVLAKDIVLENVATE